MSAKKRPVRVGKAVRTNTPLLFLMLLVVPVYGGYHNHVLFLGGALLAVLLAVSAGKIGGLFFPTGAGALCFYGLCVCGLISVPFALNGAMAFSGFLRLLVFLLFFLYSQSYSAAERRLVLDAAAMEGALLSLLSTAAFLYDTFAGSGTLNGRIDGFFQYANTWALFQLLCLLLLLLKEKRRPLDWAAMAVLLLGLLLSGSRAVLLMALPLLAVAAVRGLRLRLRRLLLGLGALVLLSLAAELLSGGLLSRRLLSLLAGSSSLYGRLLYWQDGLRMLAGRPLGLGRNGFFYLQSLEQSGVYTVRAVHNGYLQAALDYGVPGGLLALAAVLLALLRRGVPLRERLVMLAVAIHALVDFDLEYGALVFLFILCLPEGKGTRLRLPRLVPALGGAALALCLAFFSLPYLLDAAGSSAAAHALFPGELELSERALEEYSSATEAEPLADEILSRSELSLLAWDCKAKAALARGDGAEALRARWGWLRLNRYREEAYRAFVGQLEAAWPGLTGSQRQDAALLAENAALQMENLENSTSPLAWRIADKPQLAFTGELLQRLEEYRLYKEDDLDETQ